MPTDGYGWTMQIGDYLPELRDSGYADATVRHALDMLASVVYTEDYDDPSSEMNRQDRAAAWRPLLPGDVDGLYRFAATIRKDGNHGEVFQYCSLTTDVLGWVLSRVSGLSFAELLSREIWARLGCEHDAAHHRRPLRQPVAERRHLHVSSGSGALRPDGHAAWICQRPADRTAAWIDDTRFDGDLEAFARNPENAARPPGGAYRNYWWVTNDEHGIFYGTGIYGQHLWLDPTARVVIAKLSSRRALDALGDLTMRGFVAIAAYVR